MAQQTDDRPASGFDRRHELLVAVLLVVAAVATSCSSYQATRWNGEQAKAASRTAAIRIDAASSSGLAEAQTQIDVATFIAWADADRRSESGSPASTGPASAPSSRGHSARGSRPTP